MVASDLDDSHGSRPSMARKTPKTGSVHASTLLKPLVSLPPIQKTDYNAVWKKHHITRNVQQAWGHRKSTSPVGSKFSKHEDFQQTLDLPAYENPSTFRNLKSKKSKDQRSPNSLHTGSQFRSHTGMAIYSPIPASTKGSFGGNQKIYGIKQIRKQVSLSQKHVNQDQDRLSPIAMDTSTKHELKTLESSDREYRRILPSSTSYHKSFGSKKYSLGSTYHSKKNSLVMSSNNFNVYKPKPPKLLHPKPSARMSSIKLQEKPKEKSEDGLAVPIFAQDKSPRYSGIPVPKGEPYYVTFKQGEDKEYLIKIFLFKNFSLLVIDCVYGEYIWDRDKIEFTELEDLTGQGLDFDHQQRTKTQLEQFVNNCVTILNGKIVVRAPDVAPSQIHLHEPEGAQRVDKILKEMKLKNDKSYKKFVRSLTIMQKKFKSRSVHEIGKLRKKRPQRLPVLLKGAIKLGSAFYRYSVSASEEADFTEEMELEFYDLSNRRIDTHTKRVKIFDVLELIDKLKEGESYSLNKIGSLFLIKLQKFAEYLDFGRVGELIESAFEINSKEETK